MVGKKRKETPEDYDVKKDSRTGGEYPNYMSYKSRSGHSFMFDDTKGKETVTLQHRSGTAVQMREDGGLLLTTHNGKYEVVFGEDRVTVSGAQDITVKGDCSLRVYGDYNVTCHKDYNLTVMGDFNMTSKNHNRLIRGNIDTIAKNETKKMEGSSSGIYGGGYARASEDAASVVSRASNGYFGGGMGAHLHKVNEDEEGPVTISNGKGDTTHETKDGVHAMNMAKEDKKVYMVADSGKLSMKMDDRMNIKGEKEGKMEFEEHMGIKTRGFQLDGGSDGVEVKSQGSYSLNAQQKVKVESGNEMQHKAGGEASYHGSTTHVGDGQGTVSISGTTTHVEGQSALNLNGGGGGSFGGSFSQLSFNFGDLLQQVQMPSISSPGAQASESEPEADSWTSRLA